MGLLSSIIKGVQSINAKLRDLPNKLSTASLSKDVRRSAKPSNISVESQMEIMRNQLDEEIRRFREETERLRAENEQLRENLRHGAKYGAVKASDDMVKAHKQQMVSDAIDEAYKYYNVTPGTPEAAEVRAHTLEQMGLNQEQDNNLKGEVHDYMPYLPSEDKQEIEDLSNNTYNPWYP